MKRIFVAVLVLPTLALAIAVGCNGAPQGNGVTCSMLDGGSGCFFPPTVGATRTQCGDVTEYCDTSGVAAPNLACLTTASPPAAGTPPATVTLTGFVHVFSSGPDSNGVKVQVLDAAQVTAADPANQQAVGAVDGDARPGDAARLRRRRLEGVLHSARRWLSAAAVQRRARRAPGRFEVLPRQRRGRRMQRPPALGGALRGAERADEHAAGGARDRADQQERLGVGDDGGVQHLLVDERPRLQEPVGHRLPRHERRGESEVSAQRERAVGGGLREHSDDLAGLAGGITSGQGAVAGEVHDCDNVRVENAEVAMSPGADRFTYFNGNPIKTLPDASRASVGPIGSGCSRRST